MNRQLQIKNLAIQKILKTTLVRKLILRIAHLKWILSTSIHRLRLSIPGYSLVKVLFYFSPLKKVVIENNDMSEEKVYEYKNLFNFANLPKEIILISPRYVKRSKVEVESDFHFSYVNSLITILKDCNLEYKINVLEYFTQIKIYHEKTCAEIDRLLILDGNRSIDTFNQIEREVFIDFRTNPKSYVLVDHPDLLVSQKGKSKMEYWLSQADIIVIHNPYLQKKKYDKETVNGRVLLWPTFPLSENHYFENSNFKKLESILFLGTKYKNRDDFLEYIKTKSIPFEDFTHSNGQVNNIIRDYVEYIKKLSLCTLGFTNGYRGSKESVLAFRVVEFILTNTTVLYESGSWINHFYEPYVHFIPVWNKADLAIKTEFLLKNPDVAKQIAINALKFQMSEFSSLSFWNRVFENISSIAKLKIE